MFIGLSVLRRQHVELRPNVCQRAYRQDVSDSSRLVGRCMRRSIILCMFSSAPLCLRGAFWYKSHAVFPYHKREEIIRETSYYR